MRSLAENAEFKQAEYNGAFVLTEYFGCLRRDAEPVVDRRAMKFRCEPEACRIVERP